jgi:hypothetical protein
MEYVFFYLDRCRKTGSLKFNRCVRRERCGSLLPSPVELREKVSAEERYISTED